MTQQARRVLALLERLRVGIVRMEGGSPDILADLDAIAEGLDLYRDDPAALDAVIAGLEAKAEGLEEKIDRLEARMARLEQEMERLVARVGALHGGADMARALTARARALRDAPLSARVDGMDSMLETLTEVIEFSEGMDRLSQSGAAVVPGSPTLH